MKIIECAEYKDLPKPTHLWVAAPTYEDAIRQVTRPVGETVYHWQNIWAFEVRK